MRSRPLRAVDVVVLLLGFKASAPLVQSRCLSAPPVFRHQIYRFIRMYSISEYGSISHVGLAVSLPDLIEIGKSFDQVIIVAHVTA
jgi:hypothetical protein